MSLQTQNYIVYGIVAIAFLKLIYPIVRFIFQKINSSKHPNDLKQAKFQCYELNCTKCESR